VPTALHIRIESRKKIDAAPESRIQIQCAMGAFDANNPGQNLVRKKRLIKMRAVIAFDQKPFTAMYTRDPHHPVRTLTLR
jgi:hypothetical protein